MANARSVSAKILHNNEEIGLSSYIKSITYTDNASGAIDDISIELADPEGDWCGGWNPQKEDDLDVSFYLHGYADGTIERYYHCGNFCIDDITYNGNPRGISIGGVSEPADSGFKSTQKTKTWTNVTLRGIAQEFMSAYGMTTLYYTGDEIYIETIEQDDQTDSEFLETLCETFGFSLKIYKKSLVIFYEPEYEARGTVMTVVPKVRNEMDYYFGVVEPEWTWNSTLQGTYTGGTISYTNPKKGDDIKVTIGDTTRLLAITEKADSLAEAEKKVKSKVNEENKKATTFSFTLAKGDPCMVASSNIQLSGFGTRIDGKYYVDTVKNTLDASSGYSQQVECHKIYTRL